VTVALVNRKRLDESLPLFRKLFGLDPNWNKLTARLVGVGRLPDDKDALAEILKGTASWERAQIWAMPPSTDSSIPVTTCACDQTSTG
jgi:hypothetical protein